MHTSTQAHASAAPIESPLAQFVAGSRSSAQPRRVSPLLLAGLAGAAELISLAATGFAAAGLWVGGEAFGDRSYAVAILSTALVAVVTAERLDLYSVASLRTPVQQLWKVGVTWTAALAALVVALFLLKAGPDFSRGWLMLWLAAGLGTVLAGRAAAARSLRGLAEAGRLNRRAVVFGAGEAGASLVARLEADTEGDVEIVGLFDDRGVDRVPDSLAGYPLLGNVDQLVAFCRAHDVDMLILSLPITAERRLLELLKKLWVLPVDIRLAAHANGLRFRPRAYSHVGSVPMIDLFDRPLADWDRVVKTVFDRTVALAAILALSPLMALVALAVRLDSRGPVLFRQKRLGFNNELIDVWKFRSMHTDLSDANASRLVTKGDPRVTRVGRFIRKTSLDELPQLFNVLTGTLSLVGPRPHALHAKAADRLYHEVVDGYFARHKVKPGITGLAQIRGWRGETDTEDKLKGRVASDLEYIENWSLLLDLYILARTPLSLLKTENAY
ncbi:MAG: undecaprenyl-phosphate glucose phosphotransferase [Hyphomicrobiaceae bacterium]|nr:undecaprenyl-phosphate glucose phosphotransferase [Hyphomicrobiaceae bacterium]